MDVGKFAGCLKVTAAKRPRDLPAPRQSYGSGASDRGGPRRVITLSVRCPHEHARDPCQLLQDWESNRRLGDRQTIDQTHVNNSLLSTWRVYTGSLGEPALATTLRSFEQ